MILPSDQLHLDWRRPHPMTLLIELVLALRSVIVIVIVLQTGFLGGQGLLELIAVIAPMAAAFGRWFTTRYALDTESLHHHHGLIWRNRQVLPRANVQNVSTEASPLARLASLVELQVSDASATGDVNIRYVRQEEADRLTALLRSSMQRSGQDLTDLEPPDPGAVVAGPAAERRPLVQPTTSELVRAEVASVGSLTLIAATVVLALGVPLFLGVSSGLPERVESSPSLFAAGIVAIGLFLVGAGLVSRLLTIGGFRLMAEPDRLRIQVGLLTEAKITARRDRIQQVRVQRELPHRWLGIERVEFETADAEVNRSAATRYLTPVGPLGGWRPIATEIFGPLQLDEDDLRPVSPRTVTRIRNRFLIGSIPMLATALVVWWLPIPLIAAIVAFGRWYSQRRYAELGFAVADDQYLVRSGVVLGRLTLVRLDKVQTVRVTASPFQRRLDLATVKVSTAGHGFGGLVTLPDLAVADAAALANRLAKRAATTPLAETL